MTFNQLKSKKSNIIVKIKKVTTKSTGKSKYIGKDMWGNDWTSEIPFLRRRDTFENKDGFLQRKFYESGKLKNKQRWVNVTKNDYIKFCEDFSNEMKNYNKPNNIMKKNTVETKTKTLTNEEIVKYINDCFSLKPERLIMSELKWKYLIRSALRGKNILMTGPSGCGKTMAAKTLVRVLERPDFYFNLGATQDPRLTLIGNTHFNKEDGTFFEKSLFVRAIETPNSVILLDEISRAHPEAWNILMTVLDESQRYLRLDEDVDSPTIQVAPNVAFIGTANIGNEYTSTRVMDRALLDRFTTIEMDVLSQEEEFSLYTMLYPTVEEEMRKAVSKLVNITRKELKSDQPHITTMISTRMGVEIIGLLADGFSIMDAAEATIFPFYSEDGGADSERTYMKQQVQKYAVIDDSAVADEDEDNDGDSDALFSDEEIAAAAN